MHFIFSHTGNDKIILSFSYIYIYIYILRFGVNSRILVE